MSNFPDPSPGGGIHLSSGMNPASPSFRAAQAGCHKLLPSNLAGYSAIIGRGGVVLAIPDTISTQSPTFTQAAAACTFPG